MSPVTHALVGALLGRFLERPEMAFLTGVASHSVLDYLPHNDSRDPVVLLGTGCGVCAVLAAACVAGHGGMLAGALGGVLPDVEHARRGNPRPEAALFPGHHFRHEGRYTAGLGRGVEALLAAASLLAFLLAGATGRAESVQRAARTLLNEHAGGDDATNGRRPSAGGLRAGG